MDLNKVDGVLCIVSGPCNAIAPLAEEKKVPLIAVASDPKIQKDKNFVFRLEIAPSEEAKALASFVEKKSYKRIASIVAQQDGIQAGYTALSQRDPGFIQKEVAKESVTPQEKDFRTVITKLMSNNPDVIFLGLLPGMAGEFGKQARELGYTGDFIGLNFIEGEETLVSAQGKLDGIIYTQAQDPQGWFSEKYQ